METRRFMSLEICSGAGAQALGLERAGFDPVLLVDNNENACKTIRQNRRAWDVRCESLLDFDPTDHPKLRGIDLISGGLPRVKSAAAVRRAEDKTERRLLQTAIWLVKVVRPLAVLLENVPDLITSQDFDEDRSWIDTELVQGGYRPFWKILNAADYQVPQNRKSGFLVALVDPYAEAFAWPEPSSRPAPTVGEVLGASMAARGWPGAASWAEHANRPAPALVGGSDRRGGADLGPTGSKNAWAALGVDGNSLSNDFPAPDFPAGGHPKLNVRQAAMIQSIPDDWIFYGGKTSVYRQIGHAMPPPLATAVGRSIATALRS